MRSTGQYLTNLCWDVSCDLLLLRPDLWDLAWHQSQWIDCVLFSILWLRRPICNRWFLTSTTSAFNWKNGDNYGFWPTCDVIGFIKGNAVRLHYSAPAVLSNAVWISKIGPVVSKLAGCEWDTAPTVADRTLRGLQAFIPKANCPPVWAGQTDVASQDGYSVREAAWTACHAHVTPPQARSAVPDVSRFAHRHNAPLEIRAGTISLKT